MAAPAKNAPAIEPYKEGVNVVTIKEGDNKTYPKAGDNLTMHYVGTYHGGPKHGEEFDSSIRKNKPFKFQIGKKQVIDGWDKGVLKMSLGEKAVLEVAWGYGYGAAGYPGVIPKKQDLKFEVELLAIN
eukprot:CAMPEP_0202702646 /NCGR_PEP_ID=MMETSP1385-20130828/15599_1 /ASSEMBLY_ACC=CAM_ASM_000861 /TAXON_ID=933848 /ORGANISM="Elphidium margaritaceum" /LENGTH=127 /DNA_ID=CAMNT_0049360331 /DNA_START=35 /DNA_END=418 /DNA_ORIENTATION=+